MYLQLGRNFQHDETSYDFEVRSEEEATAAIFASEPLTDSDDGWSHLEFGEIAFLENRGKHVTKTIKTLRV
jgi:glutamine amidotransferase